MKWLCYLLDMLLCSALLLGAAACAAPITLRVGKTSATFELPKTFRAYQPEKIAYKLTGASGNIGVEAVAFEDVTRSKGKAVHDLTFPGSMDAEIEYLGMMRPDATPDRPESEQLIVTSTIPPGTYRWLLFRIQNTGNTIWDTEGCCVLLQAGVCKEGEQGWYFHTLHDTYVYPGESWDVWVPVNVPENTDFEVRFQLDWVGASRDRLPVWTARARFAMGSADAEFKEEKVRVEISKPADVRFGLSEEYDAGKHLFDPMLYGPIPKKIIYQDHKELQAAYARPSGDTEGELFLMVAPWSEHVTLKLVTPEGIASRSVPIKPDISALKLDANPKNTWTRTINGRQMPLLAVKWMPFQVEWYLQPFLERRMRDQIAEMKSLGVGAMAVMAIPVTPDDPNSDIYKLFTALVKACRELEMPVIWWGGYMFDHDLYEKLSGLELGRGGRGERDWEVDLMDPNFPQAFVSMVDHFMKDNADTSYRTSDGKIPFVMDVPIGLQGFASKESGRRFGRFLTDLNKSIFRKWLEVQHIDVAHLNAKWGTSYGSFEEITPEEYAEGTPFEALDSPGMIEWDDFCSEMFTKQFGKIKDAVAAKYPQVAIGYLGEEGTIWGAEFTDSPMTEHIIKGMRCEAWQTRDMLAYSKCDFVGSYATPRYCDEFRTSCEFLARHGIAQFHILRPMHSSGDLPPLYPCFKAQWESMGPALVYGYDPGGIAHLTQTQKQEMKFFTSLIPGPAKPQ